MSQNQLQINKLETLIKRQYLKAPQSYLNFVNKRSQSSQLQRKYKHTNQTQQRMLKGERLSRTIENDFARQQHKQAEQNSKLNPQNILSLISSNEIKDTYLSIMGRLRNHKGRRNKSNNKSNSTLSDRKRNNNFSPSFCLGMTLSSREQTNYHKFHDSLNATKKLSLIEMINQAKKQRLQFKYTEQNRLQANLQLGKTTLNLKQSIGSLNNFARTIHSKEDKRNRRFIRNENKRKSSFGLNQMELNPWRVMDTQFI